jgi:hypothetical protein
MTSGETRVSARPDLHELWEATGVPVSVVGEDARRSIVCIQCGMVRCPA